MDNAKIIDRARKLFAMANDASSPNEAEIAARRVRAMMDQHGITLEEIQKSTADDFGIAQSSSGRKSQILWYDWLAVGVAKYMDCKITSTHGYDGYAVKFHGFKDDAIVATLMLDYLVNSMERQLKEAKKKSATDGRRFAPTFRKAFASRMNDRLTTLAEEREEKSDSTGTSLVVVKMKMVEAEFGAQTYGKARAVSMLCDDARVAGRNAADRTNLNRQMGGTSQARQIA